MAMFTKKISAFEVRATEENRVRFSPKHIIQLPPGSITEFDLKNYSPLGFRLIQELENIDNDDYIHSICNDETLKKLTSGKIGNVFHISTDDRFLIKILRKSEIKVVLEMLPGYYRHIHNYRSSLFSRLYGVHAVKPPNGVKTYFVVMSNMLHSFMNKIFDLKGSPVGRSNKKVEVKNNIVLKDDDLDFCFYVDPLIRQRIIKQTRLDCELLEEEGIMDYSLLVGLELKESCQGSDDDELNPVYGSFTPPCSFKSDSSKSSMMTASNSLDKSSVTFHSCPSNKDSVETENSMTSETVTNSETNQINTQSDLTTLNEHFLNSPCTNFGMKIPARARRVKRTTEEEEEWYDVVLYLGIVDTFQDYGMKKRIEHCYKSLQHNSNSISTVHPKIYSSRFQEFVSNIFLPHGEDLSL